ncbi:MAG TPA: hypothetical protein DDZ68_10750 [Parvularcula sp.]|nr:hypothetical protein [Parvularcula sp.]HBS33301.1 hypothetical protein [Parvularcula sp.]
MSSFLDSKGASRGVTLLEMLVVLAIISVAAIAFAAAAGGALSRGQASRQAEMLASAVRAARADAIAASRDIDVTFDARNGVYGAKGGRAVRLPPGLSMDFTGAAEIFDESGAGVLRIYADGSTSGALVKISSAREVNSVSVDWLTGAVRLTRERAP